MKRAKTFKYPTDVLGPVSLMIQASHTNASRAVLANHQLVDAVSIKDPEMPLVPTGFEDVLGMFSTMLDQADHDYKIVKKFVKNQYNYVLIGYDEKSRTYHAWKRQEMEEHSEGFSTRYDNTLMDSLEVGDTIKKGTYVKKSTNFDKFMNYMYGKNVNTVYLVSPHVYEDGILMMNGAEKMFDTSRCRTVEIGLAANEVLLNWFGDDDHYQGIPMVGEKTRKGYAAIVRRVDSAKAPHKLKKQQMRQIDLSDRKYYATGRIIDLEILTNMDSNQMIEAGANRTLLDLYQAQQDYYRELYRYMQDIVDGADDGGYTYTDWFTIICEEAHDYVDASAYFADTGDNIYGNTKIIMTILDDEHAIVGSKFVGRSGNKGVIAKILPKEMSWHMEDGRPIHFVVAALGVISRLNHSQLNEHSANELGVTAVKAMKKTQDVDIKGNIVYRLLNYLNPEEAASFKKWFKNLSDSDKEKQCRRIEREGISIVQDPIENANIIDFARAYQEFPADYQHIIFEDGTRSMRKVLCAPMFYIRLKQDPLEKFSSRSRGPINPLTGLPSKSKLKKKHLIPYSDVAVRFGEMELEILLTMVNHPAVIAAYMSENSTSFDAKLYVAEHLYYDIPMSDDGELEPVEDAEEMTRAKVFIQGKKNIEWISAYLNFLGSRLIMDVEKAPEGEWFED